MIQLDNMIARTHWVTLV